MNSVSKYHLTGLTGLLFSLGGTTVIFNKYLLYITNENHNNSYIYIHMHVCTYIYVYILLSYV